MITLNLPTYKFRIKKVADKTKIFDIIRKKFVILQPEEWVRQHLIHYLVNEKNYPQSLLKIETSVNIDGLKQRSDIVAYDNTGTPTLIVECKAPNIKLTQSAFDQIARYNMKLKVPYLLVSNGLEHYCCKIDYKREHYEFIPEIPSYTIQSID